MALLPSTASDFGEEWVVIAGRSGLYYFDGSEPIKLSQEKKRTNASRSANAYYVA